MGGGCGGDGGNRLKEVKHMESADLYEVLARLGEKHTRLLDERSKEKEVVIAPEPMFLTEKD